MPVPFAMAATRLQWRSHVYNASYIYSGSRMFTMFTRVYNGSHTFTMPVTFTAVVTRLRLRWQSHVHKGSQQSQVYNGRHTFITAVTCLQ